MDVDLRAEVLAGIDREIADCELLQHAPGGRTLTALRHLREIVERHEHTMEYYCGEGDIPEWVCKGCHSWPAIGSWCPTLLSLAPDYAPQALKEMGK